MGDSAGTGYHLRVMPRPAKDWVIAVFWVVGIREIWEKRAQTPPNHVQSHMKSNAKSSASYFTSNETLLYSISHQIRPYPLWVELYLFHRYSGIGQCGETDPKYPNACAGIHGKQSKVFSSLFHIRWDLTLVSLPSEGWAVPISQVLGYWGNSGKLGQNTQNQVQGHMKSNPKSSAPYFTSIETLL